VEGDSPNTVAKTITFHKGGWGLTYANKAREALFLFAGSTMKYFPRNKGV